MSVHTNFETVPLAELEQKGLISDESSHLPVILVVDNEQVIADTRAAILAGWGYAPLAAYNAESALELASVIPPDVLICDETLARTNGMDLAIAIWATVPDCKVILCSERTESPSTLTLARRAGHKFALLPKPAHPKQLQALLEKLDLSGSAGLGVNTIANELGSNQGKIPTVTGNDTLSLQL